MIDVEKVQPVDGVAKPVQSDVPQGFIGLRTGYLRVVRLRLVDSFGQFVDLAGSTAEQRSWRIFRIELKG